MWSRRIVLFFSQTGGGQVWSLIGILLQWWWPFFQDSKTGLPSRRWLPSPICLKQCLVSPSYCWNAEGSWTHSPKGADLRSCNFGSVEMQCFLKSSAKGNLWCFCTLRWKGVVDEGSCVCDVVIHVWKPSIQRSSGPSRIQIAEEQWSGSLQDTEKVAFSFEKMEAWSLTMPRYLHSAVRIVLSMMAPLSNLVIQVNAAIWTRMDLITLGRDSVICIREPEGKRFCLNSKVFGLYL